MSLIVEDGTGLATAESYIDVAFFTSYFADRGITISISVTEIEQNLRKGTEYIDIRWGRFFPGTILNEDQALAMPTDYFVIPLPLALRRACAEFSYFAISNTLFINNDNVTSGSGIKSIREEVGPIRTETVYTGAGLGASGKTHPSITKGDSLMRQLTFAGNGGVIR
jgi:hypothetical protein